MRLLYIALLMVFCLFVLQVPAIAADFSVTIQKCYEELKSFSADFEQTITHRESGLTEKRRGRLLFKKPLLIRWQTAKPQDELLVVNTREIWHYLPDEEIAYRYPPNIMESSQGIIQVLTGQAALTRDFDVRKEGQEQGLQKLHLYPKEPSPQMVEAFIWIDGKGFIRRASIMDFYGNGNDVRFTTFKTDASVKAGDFTFVPPKGIDVENRSSQEADKLFN